MEIQYKWIFIFVLIISFNLHAQETVNWAKALQLSLYFYDANKCGPGVTDGRLEWRGDCHVEDVVAPLTTENTNLSQSFIDQYRSILDPDLDGSIDVSQGFHDAGDHVKFGLPQTYSASTLGWGLYEFEDAFVETGEYQHILDILKHFTDYFLKCTFMDKNGEVIAFAYMVGEGSADHTYWGPPELQRIEDVPRPVDFATAETPASDQAAGAAAALALMYLNYQDIDPDYANDCLIAAQGLYEFAKTYRGLGTGDGFYGSGFDEDELSWAAVWLYEITADMAYIDDIISVDSAGMYTGWLSRIISTTENTWQNIWVHCWDVVWGGVFVKMSHLLTDPMYDYFARWNLEYWSGGEVLHEDPADTNYLAYTPAGYGMINTWGSARYNAAAQLQGLVYNKYKDRPDIANWAKGQMEYIMGDNPMARSYEVGYNETSAKHPHHRAAHGSQTNSMLVPPEHKHTLWGALVGGPDADDNHLDDTTDFVYNEVAIDYNAGFVSALAGYYLLYGAGQSPVADFPPLEPAIDEFYIEAKLEQENDERTQVTVTIHSETVHPPEFLDNFQVRYFIDISEMLAQGQTINDVSVAVYYDQYETLEGQSVQVSGPVLWNGDNVYYYQFDWSGVPFYGTMELQFGLIAGQDSSWNSNWDPANDWSRTDVTEAKAVTQYIPFYLENALIYGTEPPTGNVTVTPTPTPTVTPTGTVITPTPTPTSTPIITPSSTPTPTITGLPCSNPVVITPDFTFDGTGENCWEAESLGTHINSWNLEILEVNGVDLTNTWVGASQLPAKIDGKYYIFYKGNFPWSHFEAKN